MGLNFADQRIIIIKEFRTFHENSGKRQVNRMDSCDGHGRSKRTGWKRDNSSFCLFVAMHPEEAAGGRFCRYSISHPVSHLNIHN